MQSQAPGYGQQPGAEATNGRRNVPDCSLAQASKFLSVVYGDDAPGHIVLFTIDDKRSYCYEADALETVRDTAINLAESHNVYFGVGLQGKMLPHTKRGTADDVIGILFLWSDIDLLSPVHTETQLPKTLDEARLILDALPLRPTMLIDSGHGLYPLWLFKEPWEFDSEEERDEAVSMSRRLQAKLRQQAESYGWKLDPTADLARVLRLPGTINHKEDPRPVKVIEYHPERRYDPTEFEDILPDEDELGWTDTTPADDSDFDPAPLEPIMAGCSWMRHCRDDAASLPEPEWYAMLGIIGRTENGGETAHEFSAPYPSYTPAETDQKLAHALKAAGPRTCKYIRHELGAESHCQQCPHWGKIKSPITLARQQESVPLIRSNNGHRPVSNDNVMTSEASPSLDNFLSLMTDPQYLYRPTGQLWPASKVNGRFPKIDVGEDDNGKPIKVTAAKWLDEHQPVEQQTWAPGEPEIVADRLMTPGGWMRRPGVRVYNRYKPPMIEHGDPDQATPWLDLVQGVYPEYAGHLIKWLAHRVQYPETKINHVLVLGGDPGIGKDTILEPVRYAVGPWNVSEVSPANILGRFNDYLESVILRISEARDLGGDQNNQSGDRYRFYEHMKTIAASPPDVLRIDRKYVQEYQALNVTGVVITTNNLNGGLYLPADDRRHYVAWSDRTKDDFSDGYWTDLYGWYQSGGYEHVAAYLNSLDLSGFNPKAPPEKTPAFWDIVSSNAAPEDAELSDVLDLLGWPSAVTISEIVSRVDQDFADWLKDRKNSRQIPHRMAEVGYVRVQNDASKQGLWVAGGKRQAVYARRELSPRDRIAAAQQLIGLYR